MWLFKFIALQKASCFYYMQKKNYNTPDTYLHYCSNRPQGDPHHCVAWASHAAQGDDIMMWDATGSL